MALLNFLYKDIELANSLYAQMFSGLMQSIERLDKSEDAHSLSGKISCGIANSGADCRTTTGTNITEKTVPHDVIFIDVLKRLEPDYKTNITESVPGDVLICKGSLYIIDNELIKLSFETVGLKVIENHPTIKANKALGKSITACMKKMIEYPNNDSKYILISESGEHVTGIAKNDFMSDQVVHLMVKFGPFPIESAYLVGIVEDGPAKSASSAANPFPSGNTDQIALEVARMFFSASGRSVGSMSVKPLAIFQKINVTEPGQ
ncbi:DUF6414 family protein [Solidesulfovibrio sp.]